MSKAVGSIGRLTAATFAAIGILAALTVSALLLVGCMGGDNGEEYYPPPPTTTTYTVTFDANGGIGAAPGAQSVNAGYSITLPNQGSLTRIGYDFGGWNTDNYGGTNYAVGSSYTPTGSITLYAKWTEQNVPPPPPPADAFTVTFDPNGGVGAAPEAQTVNAGSSITIPNQGSLTIPGYDFDCWNTDARGTGTDYSPGSPYTPTGHITLYAMWLPQGVPPVTPPVTPPSGNTFIDARDGKSYKKTTIGAQTWMAENLNYDGAGVCYDNIDANCTKYGRLYSWIAATSVCPAGWHLPSNAEWTELVTFVGSPAGQKLKSTTGWNSDGFGTDNYGFTALPGGSYNGNNAGTYGYWWAYTESCNGCSSAYYWFMSNIRNDVDSNTGDKTYPRSVRCVAD